MWFRDACSQHSNNCFICPSTTPPSNPPPTSPHTHTVCCPKNLNEDFALVHRHIPVKKSILWLLWICIEILYTWFWFVLILLLFFEKRYLYQWHRRCGLSGWASVCAFSMCKFSQAVYVTPFLFHSEQCVGGGDLWVTRGIDKSILHPVNISEWLWQKMAANYSSEIKSKGVCTLYCCHSGVWLRSGLACITQSLTELRRGYCYAVNPDVLAAQSTCDWVWA